MLRVGKDNVVVDIGFKSEGVIPISEFHGAGGEITIKAGDKVDVLVESREDENGLVLLSKEKADKMKVWDEISAACERDEIIEGTISARVKGGLSVTIRGGVKAFLPGSQVDLRPIRNLDKMIGQAFSFKVIKFNKKRGNIVLSRRVLLEAERDRLKDETLKKLQEGMVVKGVIKNITEYGAFVDLGGIDGLLHITDMSWGRVTHPEEVFKVGDEVTVKVLKYNAETERVSLGLKQTMEDPWTHAEETYPPGRRIKGKVVSIPNQNYGAFVELEPGIEGLVHISELSWSKRVKHPRDILKEGDEVECQVLEVDAKAKRISLSIKELEPDPWTLFVNEFNPGDKVSGQGSFDHRLRNLHRHPRRRGWHGAQVRSLLDGAGQQPGGPVQEERRRRSGHSLDQPRREEGLARHQAALRRSLDAHSERLPAGKPVEGKVSPRFEGGTYIEPEPGIDAYIPSRALAKEIADGTKKLKRGDAVRARGRVSRRGRPPHRRDLQARR